MDKPPMKIDEILNDVVLLVLDGHDPLKELGIEKNKIYVKILQYSSRKIRKIRKTRFLNILPPYFHFWTFL